MLPSTRQATADLHLHGRLSNTNRLSAVFKATNNVANVGRREEESKGKEQEENQSVLFYHLNCCCSVAKSCLTLCDPMEYSLPAFSVLGFPKQEYWSQLLCLSRGELPKPEIKSTSAGPLTFSYIVKNCWGCVPKVFWSLSIFYSIRRRNREGKYS